MSVGSLTMTWLLLVAGQNAPNEEYVNHRKVEIPFSVKPELRSSIKESRLYVSTDDKNYDIADTALPAESGFVFTVPRDGRYYLRVAVVDNQGRQNPDDIYKGPPQKILIVDTTPPKMSFVATKRNGEEVSAEWEIFEVNPKPDSLVLEYKPADGSGVWRTVPITAGPHGVGRFQFSDAVRVRLSMRDMAGNPGNVEAVVADKSGVMPASATTKEQPNVSPELPSPEIPKITDSEPLPTPPPISIGTQSTKNVVSETPTPPAKPPVDFNPAGASVVAKKTTQMESVRALPPIRYINSTTATVEYELTKVGPSGVGSIELYGTDDDGKSWLLNGVDTHVDESMTRGKYQRELSLPGDGTYGFTLIVKSKAGRGKRPPQPGDVPQMRIAVDTIAPQVHLLPPVPDTKRKDALLLTWSARDDHLTSEPVHLEWSERRDGPWHQIAAGIPNTGRYTWVLPASMPVRVYLRARVQDMAGNEGIAMTPEPQVVDLTIPEGRLTNVVVNPR